MPISMRYRGATPWLVLDHSRRCRSVQSNDAQCGAGRAAARRIQGRFHCGKDRPIAAAGITFARGAELAVEEMNATSYVGPNVKISLVEKESGTDTRTAFRLSRTFR